MEKLKELIPFIWIYLIVLTIAASFRGILYDDARKKENQSYNGCHSLFYKNGKIWFPIPWVILKKSNNLQVIKYTKSYNKIAYNFWVVIILLVILYAFL